MSGGSWDYVYGYFNDTAERLKGERDPLRRALGKHIELVGAAMRDIEWVDSGDSSRGDERAAIEAVLGKNARVGIARSHAGTARVDRAGADAFGG